MYNSLHYVHSHIIQTHLSTVQTLFFLRRTLSIKHSALILPLKPLGNTHQFSQSVQEPDRNSAHSVNKLVVIIFWITIL